MVRTTWAGGLGLRRVGQKSSFHGDSNIAYSVQSTDELLGVCVLKMLSTMATSAGGGLVRGIGGGWAVARCRWSCQSAHWGSLRHMRTNTVQH